MNALSYVSQHIFAPLNKTDEDLRSDDNDNQRTKVYSIKEITERDTLKPDTSISSLGASITTEEEPFSEGNTSKVESNTETPKICESPLNVDVKSSIYTATITSQSKFKEIFVTAILFLPKYLILKPLLFIWLVTTLPISFIERGIKLRNRSRQKPNEIKSSNNISVTNSTLRSIEEASEEDLSTGDEFYLQRDMVKGSLFKASSIKQEGSKIKSNKSLSNIDSASHISATTFGTKKMGRFLFPKKLIPRSVLYSKKKKTLVVDLDETLIHSISRGTTHNNSSQAHIVEVKLSTSGISTLYYVYKRPHCDHFLSKVSKWYDIVIFTASMKEYADPVIDWLESTFPGKFSKRLYRSDCTLRDGVGYIKDLNVVHAEIKNSLSVDRLNETIIIDNSPISYAMQVDNAIQVEGWISDPTDANLLNLIPLLEALRYTTDVRNILALKSGEKAFHID